MINVNYTSLNVINYLSIRLTRINVNLNHLTHSDCLRILLNREVELDASVLKEMISERSFFWFNNNFIYKFITTQIIQALPI